MFAIIETGGKQYKVQDGDIIFVEKMDAQEGQTVKFDKVLALIDGENVKIGTPVVNNAQVTASVVKNGRSRKIFVFKYNAKKNYRRRQGHRQPYTKLKIENIAG